MTYQSWFEKAPLTYSSKVEGNHVIDGRLVLGMRAGPEVKKINLLHEMAHFIEIDDARCMVYGWGLKVPETYIPGHRPFYDPQTFQAGAREIRVSAIQRVLAQHFHVPFGDYYAAKLIWDWVPGSCYVTQEFSELPSWDAGIEYARRIKLFCTRIMEAIIDESSKWSLERVREEWERKCLVLQSKEA